MRLHSQSALRLSPPNSKQAKLGSCFGMPTHRDPVLVFPSSKTYIQNVHVWPSETETLVPVGAGPRNHLFKLCSWVSKLEVQQDSQKSIL
mmetsp:Transcript_581/g.1176  ORF Transcript_581/g.1176 Transcript_581/m.1176 type:complete len:90 (-) Transcript_581:914-1183(-)